MSRGAEGLRHHSLPAPPPRSEASAIRRAVDALRDGVSKGQLEARFPARVLRVAVELVRREL